MSSEEATSQLRDVKESLTAEVESLRGRFEDERDASDRQKAQIDRLESELEGQWKDSEAAARTYEAAIIELKTRLESIQSDETVAQVRDVVNGTPTKVKETLGAERKRH